MLMKMDIANSNIYNKGNWYHIIQNWVARGKPLPAKQSEHPRPTLCPSARSDRGIYRLKENLKLKTKWARERQRDDRRRKEKGAQGS